MEGQVHQGAIAIISRAWAQYGVTLNIINPILKTRTFDNWQAARPEFFEALKEKIPLRRLGEMERDGAPLAGDDGRPHPHAALI